jgi:serine/threonine protein kinase
MSSVVGQDRVLAGRYRLGELAGSGGAGQVWRAVDLVLERPVAVKLLWPETASDPVARARFRAEARHASSLSHPGVAQVHDYGECGPGDTPFLVLELVDGSSLAGVLAAGPLGAADTIDVIAQVAAGLQAAHSAGLVHRDIKPANLLIGRDGQIKITDFGLASVTGSASSTTTGVVVGTAAYLAPERAAGQPASAACDLYSLGRRRGTGGCGRQEILARCRSARRAGRFPPIVYKMIQRRSSAPGPLSPQVSQRGSRRRPVHRGAWLRLGRDLLWYPFVLVEGGGNRLVLLKPIRPRPRRHCDAPHGVSGYRRGSGWAGRACRRHAAQVSVATGYRRPRSRPPTGPRRSSSLT